MSFTIIQGKEGNTPKKPLFLVSIVAPDGDACYLTTAASYGAPNIVYQGNTYLARIKEQSFTAIQTMSPQGYDSIPSINLTIADGDKFVWTNHCQSHGWRGSQVTLTMILWDVVANAYSTDAIQWSFIGGNPQHNHPKGETTVDTAAATNFTRLKVPSVGISYRCPWVFPANAAQRFSALNDPTSIYFQCGYSADQSGGCGNFQSPGVPFTTCDLTRSSPTDPSVGCMARLGSPAGTPSRSGFNKDGSPTTVPASSSVAPDGDLEHDIAGNYTARFGGATFLAPQSFSGRQYVSGNKTFGFNQPNPAIAGGYYNWVYGTQWVDCQVFAPIGEPNSNRSEAAVCFAPFGNANVQKLLVNGVEIPQNNPSDSLFTWRYTTQGSRSGALQGDSGFNKQGDTHGSLCVIEFVVPEELSQPGSVPSVQALVTSGPLLRCYPIATAIASGGEIGITLAAGVENVDLGPGSQIVVAGVSGFAAANGPFTVATLPNPAPGPPGTFSLAGTSTTGSGTGGGVFYFKAPDLFDGTAGAAANLPFAVADLMTWGNITIGQFDAVSLYNAAQNAAISVSFTAADGSTQTHAQFKASFALQGNARQVLAQVLTGLRNAGNLMVGKSNTTGLIQFFPRLTLADQQPAPVSGSNDTTARSSVTAAGSSASGYFAYLFDETVIEENSFRITTQPIASTPNTFSVGFQDEYNQYQQDSLTTIDPDGYVLSGNQEVQVPVQILGAPNFDQLTRVGNVQLAEALFGNVRDDAGGTQFFEFSTNHRVLHLLQRMGFICGLRWQPEGIGTSSPQPARVISLLPNTDGEKWQVKLAWHADAWYTYAYGQDPSPFQNNPIVPGGSRPPYPWRPGQAVWGVSDALFANLLGFSLALNLAAYPAQISISGNLPPNTQPSNGQPPLVPLQASVSNVGGSIVSGTYLFAFSVNGQNGPVSAFVTAVVPAGVTTGSITIANIQWQSGAAAAIQPFVGETSMRMREAGSSSYVGSSPDTNGNPTQYVFTSITPDAVGLPDILLNQYLVEQIPIVHGGCFGDQVTVVTGGTQLTLLSGSGWTTNQWQGHVLSLYYRPGATLQPGLNITVSSNTGSVLTMAASGFVAGDVVVMRPKSASITSNTIGDPNFISSYAPSGLTVNAEAGNRIKIIAGTGAGQSLKTIASNTSTVLTIISTWDTMPDATSIFILLGPAVTPGYTTPAIHADGSIQTVATLPLNTTQAQSILIIVSACDANGKSAPKRFQPFRELYIPAFAAPTVTVTSSTTVAAGPLNVLVDASGGAVTVTVPPFSAWLSHTITITRLDATTNAINWATSGDIALGYGTSGSLPPVQGSSIAIKAVTATTGTPGHGVASLVAGGGTGSSSTAIDQSITTATTFAAGSGGVPAATTGATLTFRLAQDATGGHAISFTTGFKDKPRVDTTASTVTTAIFLGGADGNWWLVASLTGNHT